jgi:lipoprotein NlpD
LRRSGWVLALSACSLLLNGCADTGAHRQDVYVVRPQDTLYSIAWRYGLDFRDLARWNRLGPDFRISVGQALTLAPGAVEPPQHRPQRPSSSTGPAVPSPSKASWVWPIEPPGVPIRVNGGGILLAGRLGQDVRAAAAGRVVYSGNGIRGYGNLIIVKHGENLLSAYAHNRDTLVREGQEVALGQLIAHMGEGAPQKIVLYFEIRRNGKPVDPLPFLPAVK